MSSQFLMANVYLSYLMDFILLEEAINGIYLHSILTHCNSIYSSHKFGCWCIMLDKVLILLCSLIILFFPP